MITVIRSEFIEKQVFARSAFLGKQAPKYADSTLGKWVVLVEIDGFSVSGLGETQEEAIQSAKAKRDLL